MTSLLSSRLANSSVKSLAAAITCLFLLAFSPWVPAANAMTTPCEDTEVTVMVEGFRLGCAAPGGSGYQTLIDAGFSIETTAKFPDFICRINGFPDTSVDDCLTASPAEAYWSYWHAPLGGSEWEYSDLGAFSYYPAAGTVEAWYWGATDKPGKIPVSKAQAASGQAAQNPTYQYNGFNPDDYNTPAPSGDNNVIAESGNTSASEATPNGRNEIIVYQDSAGNPITKEQYDALVASATGNSARVSEPSNGGTSGNTSAAVAPENSENLSPKPAEVDPLSTIIRTAPDAALDELGYAASNDGQGPQYSVANAQGTGGSANAWTIGLSLAFIILTAAAAIAAWVIRREEVQG